MSGIDKNENDAKINTTEEISTQIEIASTQIETSSTQSSLITGLLALVVALLIFSSSGSVYLVLNKSDPVVFSACNILCVSTLYAAILMVLYFGVYQQSVTLQTFKVCLFFLFSLSFSLLYLTHTNTFILSIAFSGDKQRRLVLHDCRVCVVFYCWSISISSRLADRY